MNKKPAKGTPEHHRLVIALRTLRMAPAVAMLMGGMTVEEAKAIVSKYNH